jgi:hypothetical protein
MSRKPPTFSEYPHERHPLVMVAEPISLFKSEIATLPSILCEAESRLADQFQPRKAGWLPAAALET